MDPQEKKHLEDLLTMYHTNLYTLEQQIAMAGGPDSAPLHLTNAAESTRRMITDLNTKLAPARLSYEDLDAMGPTGRSQLILAWLRSQDNRQDAFQQEFRRRENWLMVILILISLVAIAALVVASIALSRATPGGFASSDTLIYDLFFVWRSVLCPTYVCWPPFS